MARQKVKCECGQTISLSAIGNHRKGSKHKAWEWDKEWNKNPRPVGRLPHDASQTAPPTFFTHSGEILNALADEPEDFPETNRPKVAALHTLLSTAWNYPVPDIKVGLLEIVVREINLEIVLS